MGQVTFAMPPFPYILRKRVRIGLSSVLRPCQQGYMGDGFYKSKDPTNSIKVLKEMLQRTNQTTKTTKYTYGQTIIDTKRIYTK